jgi:hypothetical protein
MGRKPYCFSINVKQDEEGVLTRISLEGTVDSLASCKTC